MFKRLTAAFRRDASLLKSLAASAKDLLTGIPLEKSLAEQRAIGDAARKKAASFRAAREADKSLS